MTLFWQSWADQELVEREEEGRNPELYGTGIDSGIPYHIPDTYIA